MSNPDSTSDLDGLADEIIDGLPATQIVIRYEDGDRYKLPAWVPAKQNALSSARRDAEYHGRTPEEELQSKLEQCIVDSPHLASRWARKNMTWDELKPHAEYIGRTDKPKSEQEVSYYACENSGVTSVPPRLQDIPEFSLSDFLRSLSV